MSDKVFVIGGTGNIGKQVVRTLVENNIPTTVYVRSVDKAKSDVPG